MQIVLLLSHEDDSLQEKHVTQGITTPILFDPFSLGTFQSSCSHRLFHLSVGHTCQLEIWHTFPSPPSELYPLLTYLGHSFDLREPILAVPVPPRFEVNQLFALNKYML